MPCNVVPKGAPRQVSALHQWSFEHVLISTELIAMGMDDSTSFACRGLLQEMLQSTVDSDDEDTDGDFPMVMSPRPCSPSPTAARAAPSSVLDPTGVSTHCPDLRVQADSPEPTLGEPTDCLAPSAELPGASAATGPTSGGAAEAASPTGGLRQRLAFRPTLSRCEVRCGVVLGVVQVQRSVLVSHPSFFFALRSALGE